MNIIVLRRRLFYISAIVALLVPLYFLGNPSVRNQDGSVKQPGGTLAQLRTQYNLGQGDLGEIDPASESMRLATLGLRGVAATILWQKAEYYKKEQYWDRLSATLNQIAVLQPHFIKVWEFQSHNLSYNVSSEFDNYQHRYQWVKRGMDYLVKGTKYNKARSEMPYELGWFFGNKFGKADEKLQFRELYRNDSDFHESLFNRTGLDLASEEGQGPDQKPDNWLSGRLWYERAYDMVDAGAKPARSIMIFYRMGPTWLMQHSEAIQSEGILDEPARYAWRTAGREWQKFGERQIDTTFGDTIYLTELEAANNDYSESRKAFEEFCGETFEKLSAKRKAMLTDEQITAYEKDYSDRNFDELLIAQSAADLLEVRPMEVARAMPDENRVRALQLAKELETKKGKISHIEIYRNQINYAYWAQRCVAEQEDAALAARVNMYEAEQLLEKGELDAAIEVYDQAWIAWNDLFNKHPAMMVDDAADDVLASIDRYRKLIDDILPEDFILKKFMMFRRFNEENLADDGLLKVIQSWPTRYPDRNFLDEMIARSQARYDEEMAAMKEAAENATGEPPEPVGDETESPLIQLQRGKPNPPVESDVQAPDESESGTETSPDAANSVPPSEASSEAESPEAETSTEPDSSESTPPPASVEPDSVAPDSVAPDSVAPETAVEKPPQPKKDSSPAETESVVAEPKPDSDALKVEKPATGSAPGPKPKK